MPNPTDQLPRVSLAQLPTPIEFLPGLSDALGGPEIYVKRDDQTGLATGGNKTRKLEFLMAQALEAHADCVITAGSTQSNHARQTAAAARKLGVEPHLVLYAPGGAAPAAYTGNVLIDAIVGAQFHWTDEHAPYADTLARVESDLKAQGRRPYLVPYGGSNAVGIMGYVEAMRELSGQCADQGLHFDAQIFATSSGGTQAGMLLGAHLAGLDPAGLLGISIDEPADVLAERVIALAEGGAQLLNLDVATRFGPTDLHINDEFLGGGYAVVGDAEREAIRLAAQSDGLLVDPVYTGRALAGLIALVRRGDFTSGQRLLFWHTGGSAALFAFAADLGFA
jgi:D-cysteine desulfhydrase